MLQSIQRNVSWRAIPVAGLTAGTAFLLTNLALTQAALEVGPGLVLRYFAGLVLGSDVLLDPSLSVAIIGVLVHYALSMVFALVIAIVVHRWGLTVGIVGGAILGLAIYGINVYTVTALFEWFFAINSWVFLLSHVIFGAIAGAVYELFDHYDLPLRGREVSHERA